MRLSHQSVNHSVSHRFLRLGNQTIRDSQSFVRVLGVECSHSCHQTIQQWQFPVVKMLAVPTDFIGVRCPLNRDAQSFYLPQSSNVVCQSINELVITAVSQELLCGLILVCQKCRQSKTKNLRGGQLMPLSQLSPGCLEIIENQKMALKVVGTGLENSFCFFQLFYTGKYREYSQILGHFDPLKGIIHANFAP